MRSKKPKVSVLMPVYNGEQHLNEAIDSILNQTFKEFEFVIINDGSTDNSQKIIESFIDTRIRLINNEKNIGLPLTLNRGLDLAKGQYIARMDCDDISYPERLAIQVEFMDSHPQIGICGTWVELIGQQSGAVWKCPIKHDEIMISMIFSSAIAHPSAIFRASMIKENNLYYDPSFPIAQDLEFWQHCSKFFLLANIPQVLLKYRTVSKSDPSYKRHKYSPILIRFYKKIFSQMNISLTEDEIQLHYSIASKSYSVNPIFMKRVDIWFRKIQEANNKIKNYPEPAFSEVLSNKLFQICYKGNHIGLKAWKIYWQSSLSKYNTIRLSSKIKFALSSLIKQWKLISNLFSFVHYYLRRKEF